MVLNRTWNNTSYALPQSGERGWAALTNFLVALADSAQSIGKQFVGRRTATATPVTVTATTDCYLGVNVAGAAAAVNLPAGVNGQVFIIADESGAASTYNITITPNGANTINGTTSYVMSLDKQVTYIVFNSGNWVVLSTSTATVPITGVTDSSTIDFTLLAGVLTAIVIDNSLTDAKINSAAAIARSKIAAGTAGHVVYNDGATGALSSEAQLDKTRGGTGISSTATYPASGVVVTEAATETLTNKILSGNTAANLISGAGSLVLNTSGVMTMPNATDTAVGKATTDNMSNKTLVAPVVSNYQDLTEIATPATPGAGVLRLYSKSDDKVYIKNSSGTESILATGAPVTYTRGDVATSATIASLSSANSLVRLTGSTATSLQGISAGTAGLVLFLYNVSTAVISITNENGSASAADRIITSSGLTVVIQPQCSAIFTYDDSQSRWILNSVHGVQELIAYTPTASAGFGTVVNNSAFYKLVGDLLIVTGTFSTGTPAASLLSVSLPSVFSMNFNKMSLATANTVPSMHVGEYAISGVTGGKGKVLASTSSSLTVVYFGSSVDGETTPLTPRTGSQALAASSLFSYEFKVPIA